MPLNASVLKLLLFGAFLILLATATQTQAELVYAGWNYGPPPGREVAELVMQNETALEEFADG